ncbi:MAG: FAD-dependent oxidoreductase [Patescibacteria group bacterium]
MSNTDILNFFTEKILDIEMIGEDILNIKFLKPQNFTFLPGQFIQIQIPQNNITVLRSYSLSSLPQDDYLEICVKILKNGLAGEYFKKLKINDKLTFSSAQGNFTYPKNDKNKIIFIATGVGLSPLFSILKNELEINKNEQDFLLLFGNRKITDIFWQDRLQNLKNKYKNFNFEIIISDAEQNWTGKTGHVNDYFTDLDFLNSKFFICGNPNTVLDISKILLTKKVNIADIHFEIF